VNPTGECFCKDGRACVDRFYTSNSQQTLDNFFAVYFRPLDPKVNPSAYTASKIKGKLAP
jgi:hypothetical protein